jgi:hypothetical protein
MKKIILAVISFGFVSTCQAEPVLLACQGTFKTEAISHKANYKDYREKYEYFNLSIDYSKTGKKTMYVEDSQFMTKASYYITYESGSSISMSDNFPNEYYSTNRKNISFNRYTGEYSISLFSISKDSGLIIDTKSEGTCKIGIQWQRKF